MANNSGGLRDFSSLGPRICRQALEHLVRANRNLEKVAIEVFCSTPVDLNDFYSGYMIDIVQSFSSCQSLKEISVFTYEVDLDGTEVTWEIEAVAGKCVSETGMYPSFGRHLLHLNAREKTCSRHQPW